MNDTYCELIVKRKISPVMLLCRIVAVAVAVFATLIGILLWTIGWIIAFVFIYICIVVFRKTDIEYEYQFINGDMDIDIIYGKLKRKRLNRFDLKSIEIMAPANSPRLASYNNNESIKVLDYSSRYKDRPKYAFITQRHDGNTVKVLVEINAKMLEAIKNSVPRKVFED